MKAKKLFAVVTMVSMLLVVLCGCGNSNSNSSAKTVDSKEKFDKAMESINYKVKVVNEISDTAISTWRAFSTAYSTNVNVFT